MSNMEKQLPEMLARWKAEDMKKILVDIVGEKDSYTKEEYQAAYEWLEEKEDDEKNNFPFKRLEQGIHHLEEVLGVIGDERVPASNIRALLTNVDRDVFYFLSSYCGNERDVVNESYSKISELVQNRDATFARSKVGKKYTGSFKVSENERTKWTDSVKSEIEKLLKKLKGLAATVNQK